MIEANHLTDPNGNPAGGSTRIRGAYVRWQNGPLVNEDGSRREPNGAFVEDVIEAAEDRLRYYQSTKFSCPENEEAILLLEAARAILNERRRLRVVRGVEGTHEL